MSNGQTARIAIIYGVLAVVLLAAIGLAGYAALRPAASTAYVTKQIQKATGGSDTRAAIATCLSSLETSATQNQVTITHIFYAKDEGEKGGKELVLVKFAMDPGYGPLQNVKIECGLTKGVWQVATVQAK